MSEKSWVDKEHYRVTSGDGKQSWLFKADGGFLTNDTCIEVADHHKDGTTDAYKYDPSILGQLIWGGRGAHK